MMNLNLSKMVLSAAKGATVSVEALEGGGLGGSHEATGAGSRAADPALVSTGGGQSTAHFSGVPDHTQLVSLRNENLSGEDRIVEIRDGHAATAEVLANDRLGAMQIGTCTKSLTSIAHLQKDSTATQGQHSYTRTTQHM